MFEDYARPKSRGAMPWVLGGTGVLVAMAIPIAIAAYVVSSSRPVEKTPVKFEVLDAKYLDFEYILRRDDDTAVAVFVKRTLPHDDDILVGAVRDTVNRAFGEKPYNNPELVDWTTKSGPTKAIRLTSDEWAYYVVPVKEDTGRINSYSIFRKSH